MFYILACLLPDGSYLVFVNTTVNVTKSLFDVKFFPTINKYCYNSEINKTNTTDRFDYIYMLQYK